MSTTSTAFSTGARSLLDVLMSDSKSILRAPVHIEGAVFSAVMRLTCVVPGDSPAITLSATFATTVFPDGQLGVSFKDWETTHKAGASSVHWDQHEAWKAFLDATASAGARPGTLIGVSVEVTGNDLSFIKDRTKFAWEGDASTINTAATFLTVEGGVVLSGTHTNE